MEQSPKFYLKISNVSQYGEPLYDDILNSDLPQEEKVKQIQMRGQEYRDEADRQKLKDYGRIGLGGLVSAASFHPILNVPYVGTGIGGAMYDTGMGIMEGDTLPELAKRAGRGFVIGETVGAIPYVGKAASKTKAGQAVLNSAPVKAIGEGANNLTNKLLENENVLRGYRTLNNALSQDVKWGVNPFKNTREVLPNFIGEEAANVDKGLLQKAKNLFAQGLDNESIRQQTGWFKGVDGKWRYEIPYGELYKHPEFTEWSDIYGRGLKSYSIKLKDLYNNPELYKNYPDFAEKTVYFDKMPKTTRGSTDYEDIFINQDLLPIENPKYIEELNRIKNTEEYINFDKLRTQFNNNQISYEEFAPLEDAFNNSVVGDRYNDLLWDDVSGLPQYLQKGDEEKLRSTLIHELQHNIQNKEGFAVGGGPIDGDDYMKLAGEVEARLAAARSLLRKQGELQEISPLTNGLGGYDVAPEQQIVKFDHNGSDLYDKLVDNDEFDYNKVMERVNKMRNPKPIEEGLKNEGKVVIMKGSEPFTKDEINPKITELTKQMSKDEIEKGYVIRYIDDYAYHLKYNKNGNHEMGKYKIDERLYDEHRQK